MADSITLERIDELHPKIREEVRQMYLHVNQKMLGRGVRLRFSYTYRTPEEQDSIYAQGRTKPGKKVTNAKAWQSIHQYGLAFDVVMLYDKNGDGVFEEASWDTKRDGDKDGIPDWLEMTDYFISKGYTNGFITNGKKWDLPHFQKDFGLSWKQMKAKIDKGYFTVEKVNSKTIKYIKL